MSSILAIDAGTTGVTALVVTDQGTIAAKANHEFRQHFPKPGWVEHSPEEIWQATLEATRDCLAEWDGSAEDLAGIGITNQRETVLLWDRETLGSPRRAIVWQDRRTADICKRMKEEGHEERVTELTGLRLDPYFSGTKLVWLAENEPNTWALVKDGRYAIGTVDSYLIARMTRGTWHITDVSNACRTLLFDLEEGGWSEELCDLFGVPMDALPEIVPNWGELATTDPKSFLDLELPIAGIAGDQQSALFGQTCFDAGDSKCTYGTGSFILTNTGTEVVRSDAGLLSTAAWKAPDGTITYALEGAIFVTGAAVQWLRDGLQIVGSAAETEAIAATVDSTDGVVFVPALTGLGAPHWDPHARGTILGITRGTTRAHIVRATLEAITFEVRDVIDTMPTQLNSLMVDGGASANDVLCQCQADLLGVPVERPEIVETTALGAAFMAGLGTGVWESTDDLRASWQLDREFTPSDSDEVKERVDAAYALWRKGVERSKDWQHDATRRRLSVRADGVSGPRRPRAAGQVDPQDREQHGGQGDAPDRDAAAHEGGGADEGGREGPPVHDPTAPQGGGRDRQAEQQADDARRGEERQRPEGLVHVLVQRADGVHAVELADRGVVPVDGEDPGKVVMPTKPRTAPMLARTEPRPLTYAAAMNAVTPQNA